MNTQSLLTTAFAQLLALDDAERTSKERAMERLAAHHAAACVARSNEWTLDTLGDELARQFPDLSDDACDDVAFAVMLHNGRT